MFSKLALARAPTAYHTIAVRGLRPFVTASRCVARPPQTGAHSLLYKVRWSPVRNASTSTPSGVPPAGKRTLYPERMVIYHAGTGKTTFLACLKLTTIFTFAFFGLVATPAYISADEPIKAGGIFLCGLIPLVTVAYITNPFVTAIHVRVPPFARQSRDILARWAKGGATSSSASTAGGSSSSAPPVILDISTMSPIGKPRTSSVLATDLSPVSRRLGTVNYARDTRAANAARKWWRFRAVGEFGVAPGGGSGSSVPNGWVWEEIAGGIKTRVERGRR